VWLLDARDTGAGWRSSVVRAATPCAVAAAARACRRKHGKKDETFEAPHVEQ